nr:ATPase family AAA domain-containing protein 2-like [Oncorhynchus nerka]
MRRCLQSYSSLGTSLFRKSPRFQVNGASEDDQTEGSPRPGGSQGVLRRSTRTTRDQQSMIYDCLITDTAEAVLHKIDDMKMCCHLKNSKQSMMYSKAQRKKITDSPTVKTVSKQETEEYSDDGGDDEDDDEDDDDEDDENDNNGKRYEPRQKKAVVRYHAPLDESRNQPPMFFDRQATSTRGSYRISASVPRSAYTTSRRSGRSALLLTLPQYSTSLGLYQYKAVFHVLGLCKWFWIGSIGRKKYAWHTQEASSSDEDDSSDEEDAEQEAKNRCLPLNLRKEDILGIHKDRMKMGASLADVDPMVIDQSVRFDSVGGLTSHISALKEMVVFPLLYPEVFEKFKIQPPRGCLFYGPPGTGKTLVARALANECSQGDRKVAFFMRKGADCLSKWVGESERQLRLLFDQAYQMRPAIIFFDEIDGLAPVRSSRQDQIHSSIVSTLLALMDGLDSRGEVVVIGATNRLDSIDPALRRPGRFDREFLFGLPDRESRKDILKIHTRQWSPTPSDPFLEELADKCVGYCGADIKAVCAEAALCALRRRYPQIYGTSQKLLLDVGSININSRDFVAAMRKMVPASQRAVSSPAKALTPVVTPLLGPELTNVLDALQKVFPHAEQGLKRKRDTDLTASILEDDLMYSGDEGPSSNNSITKQTTTKGSFLHFARSATCHPTTYRPRLLLAGRPGAGQSSHLAPAVLHALEKFTVYTLDMAVLFGVSCTSPEEACAQVFCEAKRTSPSILYIPHIQQWWDTVGLTLKATFLSLLQDIPSFSPIMLLATSNVAHHDLADEIQTLFRLEYGEVHSIKTPTQQERRKFFENLILSQAARAPASKKKALMHAMEVLPLAPPPPPRQMSERERLRLEEQEEDTLRELRLFLRNVTERLSQDKRFKAFTKPVDVEEVPDYIKVIRHPMDLSTVLSKVDLHKYVTVREFVNDVDLIWKNALEYNPDSDPSDRQIRHRACALKDTTHAIIRDELDEDFNRICEQIRESRNKRGCTSSKFAPSYYQTLPREEGFAESKRPGGNTGKDASTPFTANTPRPAQNGCGHSPMECTSEKTTAEDVEEACVTEQPTTPIPNGDWQQQAQDPTEESHRSSLGSKPVQWWQSKGDHHQPASPPVEHDPSPVNNTPTKEIDQGEKHHKPNLHVRRCVCQHQLHIVLATACSASRGLQLQPPPPHTHPSDCFLCFPPTERRVTRATRTLVQQQQQLIDVDKALEILTQKTPQLVVDHDKLKELLKRAVSKTEGYEVHQLEKLYALLCQSIYRYRKNFDKTELVQEMKGDIDNFS